jgi:hypothetical protein
MPKKHHHMTKHEYKAYQKTYRNNHAAGTKKETGEHTVMLSTKSSKKGDMQLKKLCHTLRGHSSKLLDEAYDETDL